MPSFSLLEQLAFSLGLFDLSTNKPINFTTKPSPFSRVLYNEVLEIQKDLQLLYYNLFLDLDSYSFEDDFYNYLKSIRSPDKNKKIIAFYLRSDYLLDVRGCAGEGDNECGKEDGSKVDNKVDVKVNNDDGSKVDDNSLSLNLTINNPLNNTPLNNTSLTNTPLTTNPLNAPHLLYIYKQVEINTIAQCFSFFGPTLNKIHSRFYPNTLISDSDLKFINFLLFLNDQYFEIYKVKGIVAMIDNDTTIKSNNFLEKMKIIEMGNLKGIEIIHIKINEISINNNKVYYKDKLISIIYYRWFYNYDQFDEESKILRRKIENSEVINLPSAEFQMINSKGFQKILKNEKNLEKYTEKVKKIKKHFGEFRDVDFNKEEGGSKVDRGNKVDEEGKGSKVGGNNNISNHIPNNNIPNNNHLLYIPNDWILKDINEGGGHLNKSLNNSSFLMKKFKSPSFPGSFISDYKERNLISELSIFGGFVAVNGEIKYNEEGGYMVRSKDEKSLEGGVCIGAGGVGLDLF